MKNQRGQEAAPFEVLVAVVIMGFVLFMAAQAIDYVTKRQAESQLNDQMTKLIQAVQNANNGNSASIVFSPNLSFKKPKKLLFNVVSQQARCAAICSRVYTECLFFTFQSESFNKDLCIEGVPVYSNFSPTPPCDVKPGYSLIDFKVGASTDIGNGETGYLIPGGSYSIVNKTVGSGSVPTFCVYLKN
ncbi:MAG: hypothetical protein V1777_04610 [Candidatus Micrarchaeota archaeon]